MEQRGGPSYHQHHPGSPGVVPVPAMQAGAMNNQHQYFHHHHHAHGPSPGTLVPPLAAPQLHVPQPPPAAGSPHSVQTQAGLLVLMQPPGIPVAAGAANVVQQQLVHHLTGGGAGLPGQQPQQLAYSHTHMALQPSSAQHHQHHHLQNQAVFTLGSAAGYGAVAGVSPSHLPPPGLAPLQLYQHHQQVLPPHAVVEQGLQQTAAGLPQYGAPLAVGPATSSVPSHFPPQHQQQHQPHALQVSQPHQQLSVTPLPSATLSSPPIIHTTAPSAVRPITGPSGTSPSSLLLPSVSQLPQAVSYPPQTSSLQASSSFGSRPPAADLGGDLDSQTGSSAGEEENNNDAAVDTADADEMIDAKQRANQRGGPMSEVMERKLSNGSVRRELQLCGRARIIVFVEPKPTTLPPYCVDAMVALSPSTAQHIHDPAILPPQAAFVAEVTQGIPTSAASLSAMPPPSPAVNVAGSGAGGGRVYLGCLIAHEVENGCLVITVHEPPTTAGGGGASGVAARTSLDRKPDRIWLIFHSVLCHTPVESWSRFSSLRFSHNFCCQNEMRAALLRLQPPVVIPHRQKRSRHVLDVPMDAVIQVRGMLISATAGGIVAQF